MRHFVADERRNVFHFKVTQFLANRRSITQNKRRRIQLLTFIHMVSTQNVRKTLSDRTQTCCTAHQIQGHYKVILRRSVPSIDM